MEPVATEEFPSPTHVTKNRGRYNSHRAATRPPVTSPRVLVDGCRREPEFEGTWCAVCSLFRGADSKSGEGRSRKTSGDAGHTIGAFVTRPLTNFRKVGQDGAYDMHARSPFHKACMERAAQFIMRTRSDCGPAPADIRNVVNRARLIEIEANRKALLPIIDIVLTCGRQNIALRGHRDHGLIG